MTAVFSVQPRDGLLGPRLLLLLPQDGGRPSPRLLALKPRPRLHLGESVVRNWHKYKSSARPLRYRGKYLKIQKS